MVNFVTITPLEDAVRISFRPETNKTFYVKDNLHICGTCQLHSNNRSRCVFEVWSYKLNTIFCLSVFFLHQAISRLYHTVAATMSSRAVCVVTSKVPFHWQKPSSIAKELLRNGCYALHPFCLI